LLAAMLACSSVLPRHALAQLEVPERQEELNTGRTVPVIVARAAEAQDVAEVEVIGSGLALRSVVLYPASAGEVVEVAFKAGQRVRAGQVLLRLEDRRQRLAVDMAAARLDATRRLLARYENTGGSGAVAGSAID